MAMNLEIQHVDDYIEQFQSPIKDYLIAMRKTIIAAAPEAVESMSYGMPAYKFKGKPLVYFAAQKKHMGFYATPTGNEAFKKELTKYKCGRGSIQFPYSEPMPLELVSEMTKFNVFNILKLQKK